MRSFAAPSKNHRPEKKIEIVRINEVKISLWVPNQEALQKDYHLQEGKMDFPYWAKLWPSAKVLAKFLLDNPDYIRDRRVLELAGGLGLPSLFAASLAHSIVCSDYDATAVAFIEENIALNEIKNMEAEQIDWSKLPDNLSYEVILLSDINYNPTDFDVLLQLIEGLLNKGITIILTTPQRLAGRAFIQQILPYCKRMEEIWQDETAINVLVLKN